VKVDCTSLPEGLMENELFGHERGAFTGAHSRTVGKVEAAKGGTLFLDEIGDLPRSLQGKLLTLLQDRTYSRVGSAESLEADVRILAATNRPLEDLVAAGEFRKDLYYRLKVVEIALPPLRERGREDVIRLINHFAGVASKRHNRQVRRIQPAALEALLAYPWPGNVREMQNCLESAVIFSEEEITLALLPLPSAGNLPPGSAERTGGKPAQRARGSRAGGPGSNDPARPEGEPAQRASGSRAGGPGSNDPDRPEGEPSAAAELLAGEPTLEQLEARYIAHLLRRFGGNRTACARVLGIGRNTLLRKLKSCGLDGAEPSRSGPG
jgi:Nif-specific regulatory protein